MNPNPYQDSEALELVREHWQSGWGSSAPLSHLMRWEWPDRVLRFHSLPNHERAAEPGPERDEVWRRFDLLLSALMELNHSQDTLLFVLGMSAEREDLGALEALLPRGRYFATWSDGEDEDQIDYDMWLHVGPFSSQVLRKLSDEVADDSVAILFADESCSWSLGPYDGGFDVIGLSEAHRTLLRDRFQTWLPLPEQPYGAKA